MSVDEGPAAAAGERRDAQQGAWLEVWQNRFAGVCDEMGGALRRAAYSPNIKEREDFSCALFASNGELVAQAEHIPVHLGSMGTAVAAALAAYPEIEPGDQVLVNDPFQGGTHLNDITFVASLQDDDGNLLGYVANRAHHADVGGATPGSLSAEALDAIAEGLTIPPVRAVRAGEWDVDIRRLLLANTRTPLEREGDLDAQWGANRLAALRVKEVTRRAGTAETPAAMRALCDHGERRLRAVLPPEDCGPFRAEDWLEPVDGDLVAIRVAVYFNENGMTADFSGSGKAQRGTPSAVEAVTRACVEFVARSVFDPALPQNGGISRLLRVIAPVGSVVGAQFPTPVGAGNVEVSQRVVDVLLSALAEAFPGQIPAASQGTMNNVLIGGQGPGNVPFVYYETIAGGQGARPGQAGQSGIHTGMTNTANTPVEALEGEFPLRVLSYKLREGTGGAGQWAGGDGVERAIEVLAPVTLSLLCERRRVAPGGRAGGEDGRCGEDFLVRSGREECVPSKGVFALKSGDIVIIRTPGGGGLG